ncbi:MAG: response regulator transcription factor [Dysgonamonadaceae bacterium]|jgi:DNA-binding NarL/FixJ family response regulator|nr:response regulator transcription factor [Dysgonamonadaceae bacterium]
MEHSVFIIADNQAISKAGIRFLLKECGFADRIMEAPTKKELISLVSEFSDAAVVLDYTNLDFNNIEELLIVASRFPAIDWLLFSDELALPFLKRISIEEAFGILLKNSSDEEIREALRNVLRGKRYVCPRLKQFILDFIESKESEKQLLTSSEKEILKLIALGKSVKEIAEERFSSIHTITTHKKNIFRKLEVNNVYEATKYALRSGLVDATEYYI